MVSSMCMLCSDVWEERDKVELKAERAENQGHWVELRTRRAKKVIRH